MEIRRRTDLETFKSRVKDETVMGELGKVSKNVLELFRKDSFRILFTLLKKILEERWKHAADMYMNITVVKSGFVISGFEPIAQSVSKNGKYIRADGT